MPRRQPLPPGASSRGRGSFGVDITPSYKDIRTALRKQGEVAPKTLNRAMKDSVQPLVSSAKEHASYSSRIPGTIRAGSDRRGPYVKAGSQARAPHAGVFEGTRTGKNRRHPVFGGRRGESRQDWIWVEQQRRPYLSRAAEDRGDEVARRVADTLQDAIAGDLPST